MNNDLLRIEDLVNNPTARVPVCLCLDVSGSMDGEPIRELNDGVRMFYDAIREDETAQLVSQFFAGFAGELFHVGHIHAGFFRNGDCQGLGGGVYLRKSLRGYGLYEPAYRKNKRRTGRRTARRDHGSSKIAEHASNHPAVRR